MVWWLFKKREDKKVDEKLKTLNSSLLHSFSNIKKDLFEVNNQLTSIKLKEAEQDINLEELQSKIDLIFSLLEKNKGNIHEEKQSKEIKKYLEIEEIESKTIVLDTLTDTQKLIFMRLNILQKENKGNQIATKHLAQELYPNKDYNAVRSTLSEYLGILIDIGLVDKSRKGKQTYVYITDKGLKNIEKIKEKKLKLTNQI